MIPGGRREGREGIDVHLIDRGIEQQRDVEHGRHDRRAGKLDATLLEHIGQPAGARRAIAFAEQEFGRGPAVVDRQIALDAARKGIEIAVDAPEILAGRLAERP